MSIVGSFLFSLENKRFTEKVNIETSIYYILCQFYHFLDVIYQETGQEER